MLSSALEHQGVIIEGWHQAYEHALRNVPPWKRTRVRRRAAQLMQQVFDA